MLLQYVGESEGTKSTVTVPESIRECDPNRFLAMLLHIWWVGLGVRISEDKERASETITKTCPEQGKLSSFVGSIFVVSLCFKNCSQYLGSTFSQQTYLSSSSRQLRWSPMSFKFKSAFLEPKELLWLFHVSFLDFLFLLLSAGNSQLDLSCPASLSGLDSDMAMCTWMATGISFSTSPPPTNSSYTIPHLTGTSMPPSIQGQNPGVNWHSTHPINSPVFIILHSNYFSNPPLTI